MKLEQWVKDRGNGAITRLQLDTGLSYTAVHRAIRGASRPSYETAARICAATGGAVTIPEIYAALAPRERPQTTPMPTPSKRELPAKWRIVRELPDREGEAYAQCVCHRGHLQAVPIDVSPPPLCNLCLGYQHRRKKPRP